MNNNKFEEFEEELGKYFSASELEGIKGTWTEECRNAFILGITDRHFRGKEARKKIVEWLDSHPDDFTNNLKKQFGTKVPIEKQIA